MNILRCKACPDQCHLAFTVEDPSGTGQERTITIEREQFCAESFLPFASYLFWCRLMASPTAPQAAEESP